MATLQTKMRSDFAIALNQIATERGIDPAIILASIEEAIVAAFRKDLPTANVFSTSDMDASTDVDAAEVVDETVYKAQIDPLTGEAKVFRMDGKKKVDVTPAGFGRIAAQTAKQVILQKVREAEKDAIIADYTTKVGTIVTGMVLRFDGKNVIMDIGRGQGYMPPEEQMRGEFYRMNSRMTVYVADIRETMRGKTIIVSRGAKELVIELFKREVPEVASGAVEVKAIARDPGVRTKLAVHSSQQGVDPVGSCVGQKGVRVQEVIRELNNEKIDIIQYTEDPKLFLEAALAPAENLLIEIDTKKKIATVTAPDDQISLAIGRGGQNVRLAAKLTGFKITVKSSTGVQAATVTGDEEHEIDQLGLKPKVRDLLVEKGYTTLYQLRDHLDEIGQLGGIGEKAIESIKAAVELTQPKHEEVAQEKSVESVKSTEKPVEAEKPAKGAAAEKPAEPAKSVEPVEDAAAEKPVASTEQTEQTT